MSATAVHSADAASAGPDIASRVVAWQRTDGRRGLPWQRERDPYRVWLSEIMLQQTQVSVVLGYYARFLERFPDVLTLAAAPLDAVLAAWSGLGYYSRARNLHRCAQVIVQAHGGRFPASAAVLTTLPGVGRSTAAAIAAFCFGERAAILDGNVKRVLTRALGFGDDLSSARNERALWLMAEQLLPSAADMPAYTQGLMDLGATVCLARRPNCLLCPLQPICIAQQQGQPEAYPVKTRKLQRSARTSWCLWLQQSNGSTWLQQRPATGVWAGLWSLPLFDDQDALLRAAAALGAVPVERAPLRHALTHFDWLLLPWQAVLHEAAAPAETLGAGRWIERAALAEVGLPAPLRKLLST